MDSNWNDLLERGKKDLRISISLFNDESDYELAAYLAQQALEKHVKSYLLKLGVIKNPEDLKHIQITGILSLLRNNQKKWFQQNKRNNPTMFILFEKMFTSSNHLMAHLEEVRKDPEKRLIYWKKSLNIKLDDSEKTYLQKYEILFSKQGPRVNNALRKVDAAVLTEANLSEFAKKNRIDPKVFTDLMSLLQQSQQMASTKQDSTLTNRELLGKETEILRKFENIKLLADSNNAVGLNTTMIRGIIEVTNLVEIILLSFPHEDFGRYPVMIKETSTTDLYKEKNNDLWNLIQKIKTNCENLEQTICAE